MLNLGEPLYMVLDRHPNVNAIHYRGLYRTALIFACTGATFNSAVIFSVTAQT